MLSLLELVLGSHKLDQLNAAGTIAIFVVVPGNKLDEIVRKSDASLRWRNGDHPKSRSRQHHPLCSLHRMPFNSPSEAFLIAALDLIIRGGLDIGSRDTEGHSSELAIQLGDDLADSLGSTCGRGNDIGTCTTSTSPVLVQRTVDGLLSGRGSMNSGHQSLSDSKVIVNNLGEGCKTIGGAGII